MDDGIVTGKRKVVTKGQPIPKVMWDGRILGQSKCKLPFTWNLSQLPTFDLLFQPHWAETNVLLTEPLQWRTGTNVASSPCSPEAMVARSLRNLAPGVEGA